MAFSIQQGTRLCSVLRVRCGFDLSRTTRGRPAPFRKIIFRSIHGNIIKLCNRVNMYYMKRKFKQWWPTILPISTNEQSPLTLTHWTQKRLRHMTLEIQVLAWDNNKNFQHVHLKVILSLGFHVSLCFNIFSIPFRSMLL